MNYIEKQFAESLGFSDKKTKIYLALLELGEATVINIAKKSGLKRPTVNNYIPELLEEGVIHTTTRRGRRYFFIKDPRSLRDRLEDKIRGLNSILPHLSSVHSISSIQPKITLYEGIGGLKEIYTDVMQSTKSGETVLSILGLEDYYSFVPKDIDDYYMNWKMKKKIRSRVIATESPIVRDFEKNAHRELREIKIVEDSVFSFKANAIMYANKVAFISFTENLMGAVFEGREISKMQRASFELMWHLLPD